MRRLVPDLFFGGKGGLQRNMAAAMAGCKARMGRVLGAAAVMRMMPWRAGRARGADIALSDKRLGAIYARAKQRGPCIRRAQTAFGRCRCHWTMQSAENRYGNESMVPSSYSGAAAGTPTPHPTRRRSIATVPTSGHARGLIPAEGRAKRPSAGRFKRSCVPDSNRMRPRHFPCAGGAHLFRAWAFSLSGSARIAAAFRDDSATETSASVTFIPSF